MTSSESAREGAEKILLMNPFIACTPHWGIHTHAQTVAVEVGGYTAAYSDVWSPPSPNDHIYHLTSNWFPANEVLCSPPPLTPASFLIFLSFHTVVFLSFPLISADLNRFIPAIPDIASTTLYCCNHPVHFQTFHVFLLLCFRFSSINQTSPHKVKRTTHKHKHTHAWPASSLKSV